MDYKELFQPLGFSQVSETKPDHHAPIVVILDDSAVGERTARKRVLRKSWFGGLLSGRIKH